MAPTIRQRPPSSAGTGATWRYVLDWLPAILAPFFGIAAALLIIVLILEWQGADPQVAWNYVYQGTLESAAKRADLVAFWMPLAITSFGLVLTYTAGLWNIGVEGQIMMGAIGATWAVRLFAESSSPPLGLHMGRDGILIMCFVLAALTGSASGGLTIALDALGATYMQLATELGIDPALMHRVAVIGAGTLDSLPHNGAVVTLLAVCGSTHGKSYFDIVMVGIVGAIVALVAVIVLGTMFGSF